MTLQWTDIGVNLTDKRFQEDLPEVINAATRAGVNQLIITGTTLPASVKALQLAERFPKQCWCTVGMHPHHAREWTSESYQQLLTMARHPKVVAIGETGLDYNRNFSTPEQQRFAFEQQLALAQETQLPLFLHERDALDDQVRLLAAVRNKLRGGVAHCFTSDKEALFAYLELDLYIGITGWVCDERRGLALQQAIPHIPLERLLLETDAPYLMPRNLKLKPKTSRNEPGNLPHIAKTVAELYGITVEAIAEHCAANTARLFGITRESGLNLQP